MTTPTQAFRQTLGATCVHAEAEGSPTRGQAGRCPALAGKEREGEEEEGDPREAHPRVVVGRARLEREERKEERGDLGEAEAYLDPREAHHRVAASHQCRSREVPTRPMEAAAGRSVDRWRRGFAPAATRHRDQVGQGGDRGRRPTWGGVTDGCARRCGCRRPGGRQRGGRDVLGQTVGCVGGGAVARAAGRALVPRVPRRLRPARAAARLSRRTNHSHIIGVLDEGRSKTSSHQTHEHLESWTH